MISQLRALIAEAAPDPGKVAPVWTCGADEPLDAHIPFSSVIVLGTIIAVEERYGIVVRKPDLARALEGGVTLARLAALVVELQKRHS